MGKKRKKTTKAKRRFGKGDHLRVYRNVVKVGILQEYYHHGIWVGGRWPIVHFGGESIQEKQNNRVRRTDLSSFEDGGHAELVEYDVCDPASVVVARALSQLDEMHYDLHGNNCEHLATWCKTGEDRSSQAGVKTWVGSQLNKLFK